MATTKRKNTVNPEARTRAVARGAPNRKATATTAHPRAIALAVATAFLPWYLPQIAYGQTPAPNQMPSVTLKDGQAYIRDAAGTYQRIDQASLRAIYEGSMTMGVNAHLELIHDHGRAGIGLFRDMSGSLTQIFGRISSNGQVFISNQNGVLFGASARVDVGALFATSLSIKDHDFMAGRYNFYNEGSAGSVVNEGNIVTANGYTALVGPQVRNDGIIIARAGSVALAAGDRVSLDMIGDGLISVSVDQSAYNASVVNTGTITADGGAVLLTARSANALLDTVINNSGTIRANSLVERNGEIVLDGGDRGVVSVTGMLQAAGVDTGTTGGTIKVLGDKVGLFDNASVDASGDVGGGTVLVGGNWQGQGPEQNASAAFMSSGASIAADARTSGNGGKVVVWSDGSTRAFGSISARGGEQSGNGGSVETSGHYLDVAGARVDTSAPNGATGGWLLDPFDLTIVDGLVTTSTNGAFGGGDPNTWTANATGSTVADGDIEANLVTANVTITTVNGGGAENGDITVNSNVSVTWVTANTLTLNAERNVTVLGNATFTGATGTLAFNVGQANGGGTLTIPGTATLSVATVNAVGGTGNDTFNIGAWGTAGSINGAAGNDTFNVNTSLTANLVGGADVDSFAFADGAVLTGTVDGGGGSDTLDLSAYTTALTVNLNAAGGTDGATGTTAGTPNPVSGGFSNIDAVSGGTNGNTFNVTAAVTANVSGGAGADVFDIDAALTGSVSGVGGSDTLQGTQITDLTLASSNGNGFSGTSAAATFSGIDVITGAGGGTLTGENVASTWALDGTPTYFDGTTTLDITGFTTLAGGTAIDTFDVTAASAFTLNGGAEVDVFNLNATLTGSIDGQANGATLDGTNVVNASLTGAGGTIGYNGSTDATALTGTFSNITTINGNGGGTLTGTANASAWSLNGTGGSYTDNAGTNSVAFTGMSTLQGGAAIDTFTLAAASTFNLAGGAGVDVFALATNTLTGSINGQVDGGSITGIGSATLTGTGTPGYNGTSANVSGGFSNITNLSGTGTLTGTNSASSWSALNATSGSYSDNGGTNTSTFSGFATLQGGTAVDTFTLTGAATFNLAGGDGVDVFALATNTLTGSINGQADGGSITGIGNATLTNQGATTGFDGTSANVSTGFSNITSLSGTGTLTGDDVASTWALDGTPTYSDGTRTLDIAGFANLQGNTAADTFNVTAASTFNLLGGAGADVFSINAALTGTVSGETGSDTLQGTQIGSTTLTASTAADGFSGTTTGVTGFSGINVLNGSGTLTGRDVASTWSVDGATYTDGTATLTHSGFGTLQGGTAIDTFNLAAAATANLLGGDGADVFNVNAALTGSVNGEVGNDILSGSTTYVVNAANAGTASNVSAGFTSIENLAGTGGADGFTLSGGGTLTGTIDGLAGTDTLTGDNVANVWTITGPNAGTLTGTGGWSNIENLVGGTSTDSFSGVPAGSVGGTISDGGGGATTLSGTIISGGSQTYSAAVSAAGVTLNAGTGSISATNAGNDFTGTLDVTGSSASITDMNALTIDASLTGGLTTNSGALTYVAGMSVGSLNSTASGAVDQTGAIAVTGATTINAGANSITLTSANDFQGAVSFTGGTTQITDANALTLGAVNTGALTTINTGALNLGTGTVNGALSATTNGGNITQTGALNVTGTTNLQAGAGSIMLAMANDFGGTVTAGGIGITLNDINTLTPGTINAGSGSVNLSANSLAAGGPVSAGSASSFSSNTNVNGLNINMPNVPLSLTGSATQWNFISTPTSIAQPNPITVPGGNVGVTYNLASIVASVAQQQAASASSSVSASVAAVIVDEANKTFGTDSVAEDVEYGFAGEIGATPPMDHRIDESGISLPRCVQESREGVPCK